MDVMVSVVCLAYNHEKYIRKCLDGFVMQKTNFPFEVLINDDASTDGTARIIREYEAKYPDIIKPTYQTENQFSQGVRIVADILMPQAKGKYIAFCEGDDYWIDEYKLQKQFDVMEQNPNCHMCVHTVQKIYESGEYRKEKFPAQAINNGVITKIFLDAYFQTSCYFVNRAVLQILYTNPPEFSIKAPFGDIALRLFFLNVGDIYYIDEMMSCYRVNSISSVARCASLKKEQVKKSHIETLMLFDSYSEYRFHNSVIKQIRNLNFDLALGKKDLKLLLSKDNREILFSYPGIRSFVQTFFPRIMNTYYQIKKVIVIKTYEQKQRKHIF